MKKNLMLFTNDFPFSKHNEDSFLLPEIPHLLKYFNITIIAKNTKDEQTVFLDKTIKIIRYNAQTNKIQKIAFLFRAIFSPFFLKEVFISFKEATNILYSIKEIFYYYIESCNIQKIFVNLNLFEEANNTLYYTYWCMQYTLALTRYKEIYNSNMRIVTRVHGQDIHNFRMKGGWQPFRLYMDKYLDKIIFVANGSRDYYLKTWHKTLNKKYIISRLGSIDSHDYSVKEYHDNDIKTVVSCSALIPRKRVELIVEALSLIDTMKIKWVHIGLGTEHDTVENIKTFANELLGDSTNIDYVFLGHLPISDVYNFYRKNFVDLFITVSSSEGGCPVSMAEAISVGIPVMGTDVGGIPEVLGDWGVLLPANPSPSCIAEAIKNFFNKPLAERKELSLKARQWYNIYFNADKNAEEFCKILLQCCTNKQDIYLFDPYLDQSLAISRLLRKHSNHFIIHGVVSGNIPKRPHKYYYDIIHDDDLSSKNNNGIVIPTGAIATKRLLEKKDIVLGNVVLSQQNLIVFDKISFLNIARQSGIPIPKTWTSAHEIPIVEFPVFYKQTEEKGGGIRGIAKTPRQLSVLKQENIFFQEYIPSKGTYGVSFIAKDGRLLCHFTHFERESIPKEGGSAVIIEKSNVPRIIEYTKTLLQKIHYSGWGLAEYKYCDKRDDFVLMEINSKFWASCEFAFRNNPLFFKYFFDIDIHSENIESAIYVDRALERGLLFCVKNRKHFIFSTKIAYSNTIKNIIHLLFSPPPPRQSVMK
jgi:glycosyltransferase involved in cell wall biosynthesis